MRTTLPHYQLKILRILATYKRHVDVTAVKTERQINKRPVLWILVRDDHAN